MPIISSIINAGVQDQTNRFNYEIARMTNEFNAAEAQKNRDFQERMSNTEIQRKMEDLKAAGLNPYSVIEQGGASTPSGSAASGSAAHMTAPTVDLSVITPQVTNLLNSALILQRIKHNKELLSVSKQVLNATHDAKGLTQIGGVLKKILL